jgi:hypothetical protein
MLTRGGRPSGYEQAGQARVEERAPREAEGRQRGAHVARRARQVGGEGGPPQEAPQKGARADRAVAGHPVQEFRRNGSVRRVADSPEDEEGKSRIPGRRCDGGALHVDGQRRAESEESAFVPDCQDRARHGRDRTPPDGQAAGGQGGVCGGGARSVGAPGVDPGPASAAVSVSDGEDLFGHDKVARRKIGVETSRHPRGGQGGGTAGREPPGGGQGVPEPRPRADADEIRPAFRPDRPDPPAVLAPPAPPSRQDPGLGGQRDDESQQRSHGCAEAGRDGSGGHFPLPVSWSFSSPFRRLR